MRRSVSDDAHVGAWGPGIFSDDLAADIRSDYRELLEDEVSDDDAMRRLIEDYQHLDSDEEHVLWLALASTQSRLGRLDATVKARALEVIDSGRGLELWEEAGPSALTKRKSALAKLRDQLTGPQPARKRVIRPWRHETDLRPGDILSFTASNGLRALLRVARVDEQRIGAAPILEWLDWNDESLPRDRRLRRLNVRTRRGQAGGPARPATFLVARYRKKDPDWHDYPFILAAQVPPRSGDELAQPWSYLAWEGMVALLEREMTS